MSLSPTEEQKEVIKAISTEKRLKIEARAGTGKTTTLHLITKAYERRNFLLLAFNRAVTKELQRRVGRNSQVYTINSLALRFLRREGFLKGDIAKSEVLPSLISEKLGIRDYGFIRLLLDSFEEFCNSDLSVREFDEIALARLINRNRRLKSKFLAFMVDGVSIFSEVAKYLRALYGLMDRGELPFTHGFYQKKFAEVWNRPLEEFDTILLDEAQDVNPVQLQILRKISSGRQLILVGDRHQSIYGWRGAVNSMEKFDFPTKYLTLSFRFQNDSIVRYANSILQVWKGEEKKIERAENNKRTNGKTAHIYRTNVGLINDLIRSKGNFKTERPLDALFKELFMAEKIVKYLNTGNEIHLRGVPYHIRELLKRADSKTTFLKLLEKSEPDIAWAVSFVEDVGSVDKIYDELEQRYDPYSNEIYLTAHTSKGLEFDRVFIGGDFFTPVSLLVQFAELLTTEELLKEGYKIIHLPLEETTVFRNRLIEKLKEGVNLIHLLREKLNGKNSDFYKSVGDEINLSYVAITRAIKELEFCGHSNPVEKLADVGRFISSIDSALMNVVEELELMNELIKRR